MDVFEKTDRLYEIHKLIQQENTGTPDEFAKRFLLSRKQVYNIMESLKERGAVIKYSRIRCTFFYFNDFEIALNKLQFSSGKEEKDTLR
jgi:predicted DNA-binding transcriptional regulator YafY